MTKTPTSVSALREQLVRAPGQHLVHGVDVGVGTVDDPALVGLVEIAERKPLDVLEDLQPQIVHHALADADGRADLRDGQGPAEEKIAEVDCADDQDAVRRVRTAK